MAVPITLALISVGVGMSALTLLASMTTFHKITPILATMIGLGVAIDYTLFILMRFRQGLADGLSPVDASVTAVATAGRAVIFAGLTVAISISGLFLIGIPFVTKMGLGTALAVMVSVLLAISLLPAVLAKVGHRVNSGRIPFLPADAGSDAVHAGAAARFGRAVTRRPKLASAAVLVLLAVVAIPTASIRLGTADAGTNPPETTTRKAYDMMAEGFGAGVNGPLLVAVDQQDDPGAAKRLAASFQETPGVAAVLPPVVNDSGDTAQVVVYPTTSPQSSETSDLVSTFRDEVVPEALAGSSAHAYVGGPTAANEDMATMMIDRFPLFLLFVVGTTFLLLTMAFRSVVIALKAALTTLLSAAAAFGVLVAVFQWGWGINLIGLDNTGPTASYLPVIVLSILFGLSMDYEVFLASRIREEYVATGDARTAITDGVGAVGRVIVAAALIMGAVFWAFVLTDDRTVKSFGVGLGVAILVDALLVRMVLVPAVMQLLGDRAWYMPRWLDRLLPNLTIEPAAEPAADEADPELERALPQAA
jgi:RND superfamily putative drug exporter